MINISCSMPPEEILSLAHRQVAIPSLIIMYIFSVFMFLIVGLFLIDRRKSGYGKFMIIWLTSFIFITAFFVFLWLSPNSIQWAVNLFS